MEIKDITKNDLDMLCKWHKEHVAINFPDSKYKKKLFEKKVKEYLAKGQKFVFMKKFIENKKMVAWLWLVKVWDEFKDLYYCDLHYIHVDKSVRGKGIGKLLMLMTEEWAKKNGMKEIRLGTSFDNKTAIILYEKARFFIKRVLMEKRI